MFEKAGFDYERPKGKNHCVMRKVVPPALTDRHGLIPQSRLTCVRARLRVR
jgi:hypothetical protein